MEHSKNAEKWWRRSVIYQIYPKSFQDSNSDGIGDLEGIIKRLPYLHELGVEAIWISPVYRSPQDDNGYDIADYQDIDPMFGSLDDMDRLIQQADKYGIGIIMDLVLNHTSDEHFWFTEAKKSRDNPYHDYYVWRDGMPDNPPNTMKANFGGSAWEWVPELQQYYFHQFSVKQPDLNWENEAVREEIYKMIRWWMKRGVRGFRLDVIDQIAKEPDLEITENGPMLHTWLRELNKETFGDGTYLTVGEAWGATTDLAKLYSAPDGSEFSMVFQFEHIGLDQEEGKEKWDLYPLDFQKLKQVFKKWQEALYNTGWNSLFWNNHDLPRIVSRWGNDQEYRVQSAKMLAILLHGMQGTPYIYQGEELGMTNVTFSSIWEYRDIETINMYHERLAAGYEQAKVMQSVYAKGRDNARTPMQWDCSQNAGFTDGEPWIQVNKNYAEINAEDQMRKPDSIWNCYRQLIQLRKQYDSLIYGSFELCMEKHREVFAYKRVYKNETLYILCNFYGNTVELAEDEAADTSSRILISSYSGYRQQKGVKTIRSPDIFECIMERGINGYKK